MQVSITITLDDKSWSSMVDDVQKLIGANPKLQKELLTALTKALLAVKVKPVD